MAKFTNAEAAFRKDRRTAQKPVVMQHRHMAFIADVISRMSPNGRQEATMAFAQALRGSNVHFNIERFIAACSPQVTTEGNDHGAE